jgi:hypothetical protein
MGNEQEERRPYREEAGTFNSSKGKSFIRETIGIARFESS